MSINVKYGNYRNYKIVRIHKHLVKIFYSDSLVKWMRNRHISYHVTRCSASMTIISLASNSISDGSYELLGQ